MQLLVRLVAFACLLFLVDLTSASHGAGLTNAERFKRGYPPLPPRGLTLKGKRHVRPVRARSYQGSCPSPTPAPPGCTGCANILVTDATTHSVIGYMYPTDSAHFGVTPCQNLAWNFDGFPASVDTEPFEIMQFSDASSADHPCLGLAGLDANQQLTTSSSDSLVITSTSLDDPNDPDHPEPNAPSATGYEGESTVWLYVDGGPTIQPQWTNEFDQSQVILTPIWNNDLNQLLVTGSVSAYSATAASGTIQQVILSVVPLS